mmetsp:Transcript_40494/g.103003  ORF Transcript_40494/g.103003 Transcript_40494/m.103003 type:complete len:208 (-) Transcript_40494:897-1520(-)
MSQRAQLPIRAQTCTRCSSQKPVTHRRLPRSPRPRRPRPRPAGALAGAPRRAARPWPRRWPAWRPRAPHPSAAPRRGTKPMPRPGDAPGSSCGCGLPPRARRPGRRSEWARRASGRPRRRPPKSGSDPAGSASLLSACAPTPFASPAARRRPRSGRRPGPGSSRRRGRRPSAARQGGPRSAAGCPRRAEARRTGRRPLFWRRGRRRP